MSASRTFRAATYNIHKCQGFDRRTLPERIIEVIRELDADILCLQEVVNAPEGPRIYDQAGLIARAFPEYVSSFGATRPLRGGTYGNMTLTRLPLRTWRHHDISRRGREPRGVLQTELDLGSGEILQAFNIHLGTSFLERRYQARRLLSKDVLMQPDLTGARLVLGDFNEWTRGLTSKLLAMSFDTFRPQDDWRLPGTFPSMLPVLTLDHCYYESPLELEETRLWRTRRALIASDHLPLIATFRFARPPQPS
jgi:endonuclease/exonuclease/phosphatase family metal-dependent hydrolase